MVKGIDTSVDANIKEIRLDKVKVLLDIDEENVHRLA